jgi:hypothetical protein
MRLEQGSRSLEHEVARHMLQVHEMVLQAHGGGLVTRHMPRGWSVHPEHGDLRKKFQFCDVFTLLVCVFAQVQVEIFPINTAFLIHNFSFRTRAFQEEGYFRSFRRSFSIFSLIL